MCETCGCSKPNNSEYLNKITINEEVLKKNDSLGLQNRERFTKMGLFVINLISSPGSGKTLLLERLAGHFGQRLAVIEGDIQTSRDTERMIRKGCKAFQIMTRGACHLNSHSIEDAVDQLDLTGCRLLVIENVGNLVCPATYYLGEHEKFAMLSLPEGDDKILKYPALFLRASVLIINKMDLKQYLDFEIDKVINECQSLNNDVIPFCVSAKTGVGFEEFIQYIERKIEQEPLVC